jgi:hypothetical protein
VVSSLQGTFLTKNYLIVSFISLASLCHRLPLRRSILLFQLRFILCEASKFLYGRVLLLHFEENYYITDKRSRLIVYLMEVTTD